MVKGCMFSLDGIVYFFFSVVCSVKVILWVCICGVGVKLVDELIIVVEIGD